LARPRATTGSTSPTLYQLLTFIGKTTD
jgi:hypothetical protein